MKGLLHSKRFRANLRKWLFMYVGVMVLLTSVITYSKFISNLNMSDEARVTRFNMKIDFVNCSAKIGTNLCKYDALNPDIASKGTSYEFTVDPSELEVNTDVTVTAHIDTQSEGFTIKNISEVMPDGTLSEVDIISKDTEGKKSLSFNEIVSAIDTRVRTYRVEVDYQEDAENENYSYSKEYELKISYIAKQIKE